MRPINLLVICCLAAVPTAYGQTGQPPAAVDPEKLDGILNRWEAQMKGIQSFEAEIVREKNYKNFKNANEVFTGKAFYLQPNLALLHLEAKGRPERFERFVCSGTHIYQYSPAEKVIYWEELPPPKAGKIGDDNFLSFVFGMKAQDAKQRYNISLFKEDKFYHYLRILPIQKEDKAEFTQAYLILIKESSIPRTLVFDEVNGNRVKWDIPKIEFNVRLNRLDFLKPTLPAGWEQKRAPKQSTNNTRATSRTAEPPPRVVRPNR